MSYAYWIKLFVSSAVAGGIFSFATILFGYQIDIFLIPAAVITGVILTEKTRSHK